MKNVILTALAVLVFASSGYSTYAIKPFDGRIEAGIGACGAGFAVNLPSYEAQLTYNFTSNLYAGAKLSTAGNLNMAARESDGIIYNDSMFNTGVILGARTGPVCERYVLFINAIPNFSFITRKTVSAPDGLNADYNGIQGASAVLATKSVTQFSPSIEFGFSCSLTDNLLISTCFSAMFYATEKVNVKPVIWLIQTGPDQCVFITMPVRVSWRF